MSEEELIEEQLKRNIFLTTVDKIYNWGRKSSMSSSVSLPSLPSSSPLLL